MGGRRLIKGVLKEKWKWNGFIGLKSSDNSWNFRGLSVKFLKHSFILHMIQSANSFDKLDSKVFHSQNLFLSNKIHSVNFYIHFLINNKT